MECAAGSIYPVLEPREGFRVVGTRVAEGVVFRDELNILVLVLVELGFGVTHAAEGPLAVDEVVEVEAGLGGGGLMALVILFDEFFEVAEVLRRGG